MDDYKDIKELLKPRRDIKASAELHLKVRNALEKVLAQPPPSCLFCLYRQEYPPKIFSQKP